MIDAVASKLLFSFMESQDKLDVVGRVYGFESDEYSESLEQHSKLFFELKELIHLGLVVKEKGDCNGNV